MEGKDKLNEFNNFRDRMNNRIWSQNNKVINRFFNLDQNTYQDGVLPLRTKEMLGLVASMVLRCDDCINYHLGKCHEEALTDDEIYEVFSVALVVGGSIVIPHLRRAADYWDQLKQNPPTEAVTQQHNHTSIED